MRDDARGRLPRRHAAVQGARAGRAARARGHARRAAAAGAAAAVRRGAAACRARVADGAAARRARSSRSTTSSRSRCRTCTCTSCRAPRAMGSKGFFWPRTATRRTTSATTTPPGSRRRCARSAGSSMLRSSCRARSALVAVAARRSPAARRTPPAGPVETLRAFADAVRAGRTDDAYALMSADYQKTHDRDAFERSLEPGRSARRRPAAQGARRAARRGRAPRRRAAARWCRRPTAGASRAIRSTSTRSARPTRRCARSCAPSSASARTWCCASSRSATAPPSPSTTCSERWEGDGAAELKAQLAGGARAPRRADGARRRRGAPPRRRAQAGQAGARRRRCGGSRRSSTPSSAVASTPAAPPSPVWSTAKGRSCSARTASPTARARSATRCRRWSRRLSRGRAVRCAATRRRRWRATAATTSAALGGDLVALARHFSPGAPARLVGHDWGAVAAYAAVALAPGAFSHLVTIAVPHLRVAGRALRHAGAAAPQLVHGLLPAAAASPSAGSPPTTSRFVDRLWRDWSPGLPRAGRRARRRQGRLARPRARGARLLPRDLLARHAGDRAPAAPPHAASPRSTCTASTTAASAWSSPTESSARTPARSPCTDSPGGHFVHQEAVEQFNDILVEFSEDNRVPLVSTPRKKCGRGEVFRHRRRGLVPQSGAAPTAVHRTWDTNDFKGSAVPNFS